MSSVTKINAIKYQSSYKQEHYAKMAQFNCGKERINTIFRKDIDKIRTTTYIFTDKESEKIISFVSFCASSIQIRNKRGLFSLPAVELKLFGVDKNYQHKNIMMDNKEIKYSEFTFLWLISYLIKEIKPLINVEYLILHSIPDKNTLKFYEKMGMQRIDENKSVHDSDFSRDCIPMYLKL